MKISEFLEAKLLVAWCAEHHDDLELVRIPNKSEGVENWARQVAEGAKTGTADYVFLLKGGRSAAWELKRVGGKLRPDQRVWLARVDALGIPNGWGTSREAIAFLGGLIQEHAGASSEEKES